MVPEGREAKSRTYYILGTDCRLFWNVSIWDPRHNSYHYMVLGCLRIAPLRENSRYLGGCKRLHHRPPTAPKRDDGIFADLWRPVLKPQAHDARENAWILEATWRLVDERVSVRRDTTSYQSLTWRLGRAIAVRLKGDR